MITLKSEDTHEEDFDDFDGTGVVVQYQRCTDER